MSPTYCQLTSLGPPPAPPWGGEKVTMRGNNLFFRKAQGNSLSTLSKF